MPIRTLYVIRHADRPWNLIDAWTPTGIPGDVPLTTHGLEQAKELVSFFMQPFSDTSRPIPDRIYSSAYWRTLQTISYLPCAKDRIFVEPGLGERILADGYHPPIPLSKLQTAHFPGIDPEGHKPVLIPRPDKESRNDLLRRMADVMDLLIRHIEEEDPSCETVLIGTHASPALCIARALLGNSTVVHTYTAGATKYVRKRTERRLGAWKLDWNCRCDFLSHGGEHDWTWAKDTANVDVSSSRH